MCQLGQFVPSTHGCYYTLHTAQSDGNPTTHVTCQDDHAIPCSRARAKESDDGQSCTDSVCGAGQERPAVTQNAPAQKCCSTAGMVCQTTCLPKSALQHQVSTPLSRLVNSMPIHTKSHAC